MKSVEEQITEIVTIECDKVRRRGNVGASATALAAVGIISKRAPVAFGELRDSIHSVPGDTPETIVDAPHAVPVEIGSAPHTPNFDALVKWVKLRGMQSLTRNRSNPVTSAARLKNWTGATTKQQASRVRGMLDSLVNRGEGGAFSPTDAAEQVAMAISKTIEKYGTKPHFFVKMSLPAVERALRREMRRAIRGG